ncbi:MAG: hypothetical protein LBV69_11940 [Bacteroidales bacterium]|jgi:hypothetical protein|nr:hypothetical protein [Bacteroidales bacterium]
MLKEVKKLNQKQEEELKNVFQAMKLEQEESEKIKGGANGSGGRTSAGSGGGTGTGSGDAWICIGSDCNKECNTSFCKGCTICETCITYGCNVGYGA